MTINSLRDEFIKKYNMDKCNILEKRIDNVTFIYIFFDVFMQFIKDLKLKFKKCRSLCVESNIKKLCYEKIKYDTKYIITLKRVVVDDMPRHLYREIYVLI